MTDIVKKDAMWDIDRLKPYPQNSKKHEPKQVSKIAASIRKYGWTSRIVVEPDGTVIAGHGRRLAAIELLEEKVPVTILEGITKEQARALRLIDNKVQEGGYDTGLLSLELRELVLEDGVNMSEFFDARDLNFAIDDLGDIDLDSLSLDISPEVAAQTTRTEEQIEATDENEVSLTRAIGFTKVSGEQGRDINVLIGMAVDFYGVEAPEALLKVLRYWATDTELQDVEDPSE